MFPQNLIDRLHGTGVVAVLTIDNPDDAVPLAKALLQGGVACMELTLRTPRALEALRRIRDEVPEMMAGVGTILTTTQVNDVVAAGAAFGVAPGMNVRVATLARSLELPFAPGVCTPSDIEQALECGCRVMKFFPAEPLGGMAYLKSITAPYAHLGVTFIPLGGIDTDKVEGYLREPSILALGGSWIAPRDLIQKQDWDCIAGRAKQVAEIVEKVRPKTKS